MILTQGIFFSMNRHIMQSKLVHVPRVGQTTAQYKMVWQFGLKY